MRAEVGNRTVMMEDSVLFCFPDRREGKGGSSYPDRTCLNSLGWPRISDRTGGGPDCDEKLHERAGNPGHIGPGGWGDGFDYIISSKPPLGQSPF